MLGNSAIQRKKSLPDVAALPTVTVKQGSQAMTREEISVLSSARREEIRRQLEEAERYRANPVLYILNPHIRVSLYLVQRMFQNSSRKIYIQQTIFLEESHLHRIAFIEIP